eukprot:jgi/Tetstr1/449016/TSEL_036241.t1
MRCAVQTPRDARSLLEAAYEEADRVKIGVGDFTASLPDEDRQRMSALSASQGAFAWTYGELTYEGASQLQDLIGVGPEDVFYDLGSGLGRLVLQAHLDWGVARAVGVELSAERHNKGVLAAQRLASQHALDPARRISLINGNLLTADVSDATCVYLACTCWDSDFMTQVLRVLEAGAPRLRWLVCTESLERKFGLQPAWLQLDRCERVSQTWAPDGYPLHVYMPGRTGRR